MRSLNQVLVDLDGIARAVDAEENPNEKISLREQQAALREEAATIRRALPVDIAGLKRELDGAERQLAGVISEHVDSVGYAGGGSGGGSFGMATDALNMNNAIDAGAGRPELEEHIDRLRQQIHESESSPS